MEIIEKENPALVGLLECDRGVGSLFRILEKANAPDAFFRALSSSVADDGVWSWDEREIFVRVITRLDDEGEDIDGLLVDRILEAIRENDG